MGIARAVVKDEVVKIESQAVPIRRTADISRRKSGSARAKPPMEQKSTARKPLDRLANSAGGKLQYNEVYGGTPPDAIPPAPNPAPLIIGFDSEWVPVRDESGRIVANRLLSYQYACRFEGHTWSGIIYPDAHPAAVSTTRGPRLRFADILGAAIAHGMESGYLARCPAHVMAAAHWTRADLAHVADFPYVKRHFKGVKKTYTTLGAAYKARAVIGGKTRRFSVTLVDTQLLVPGTTKSLEQLGTLYQFDKLDPGKVVDETGAVVSAKERMDLLLASDRDLFESYAIRDAEICALHVEKMIAFVGDDLGLCPNGTVPVTLGALTVDYLLRTWEQNGIDAGAVNGYLMRKETHFNKRAGKGQLTKAERVYDTQYLMHEWLAKACFLGGRNEDFWYGPTTDLDPALWPAEFGRFDFESQRAEMVPPAYREYDLTGAYATALASIGIPDYSKARITTDPSDFRVDQPGYGHVRFEFPPGTRFPCIPVRDTNDHGLIFPLSGEAFVTSPEIVLALRLGAKIEVLHGVIIPWIENSPRPFELVIRELARRRAEHPKGSLPNEMFKQLGNSIYGKLGQGIKEKSYFNTKTDGYEDGKPCPITNPYLAAFVTGLIRALLGEMIASIHPRYTVVSVTTDALITNAPLGEICLTGPVALHMSLVKARLTAGETTSRIGAEILETKFEARQLMPWRNKGVATLRVVPGPNGKPKKPKLAQGGMRAAKGSGDENAWFCRTMLDREYGTMWESSEPPPFPKAHKTNADHVFAERRSRVNFEYDMKRRLVEPFLSYVVVPGEDDIRIVPHLSCNTVPWHSVEEFSRTRAMFEQWRHKQRGQLKGLGDFKQWEQYRAGDDAARAGVSRRGGVEQQAMRLFLRAYVRSLWGLPGGNYKEAAAALSAAGYRVTEQHFKDAKRAKGVVPEQAIPADSPGVVDFVRAVLAIWPDFEWRRFVAGGLVEPCGLPADLPSPHDYVEPRKTPIYRRQHPNTGGHDARPT